MFGEFPLNRLCGQSNPFSYTQDSNGVVITSSPSADEPFRISFTVSDDGSTILDGTGQFLMANASQPDRAFQFIRIGIRLPD